MTNGKSSAGSAHYQRRCACRGSEGKQLGAKCPKLSNARHGTWQVYVNVPATTTAPRERIRKGGFASKGDAETWAAPYLRARLDGQRLTPTRETLAQYLPRWLEQRKRTKGLKPSTVAVYELYMSELIASGLGRVPLTDIRRSDVQALVNDLASRRGAQTVAKIAVVLKGAFSDAERSEVIASNPARLIDLPKIDQREKVLFTPSEVAAFFEAARESSVLHLYEVAAFTGLRRGELAGLRWIDVDFDAKTLTVRTNRVQVPRRGDHERAAVFEGSAKTKAGQGRVVGLGPRALRALRAQKASQNTDRLAAGDIWQDSGRVFAREDGSAIMPEYPSRLLEKLASRAGLPAMSLHGFRHLHATHLRETGADGFLIAKRLGHAHEHVTAIYAHVSVAAQIEAAERAERVVPAAMSTQSTVLSTTRSIGATEVGEARDEMHG